MNEKLIAQCEKELSEKFLKLDKISLFNQEKVLNAFKKARISLRHFNGTTGYGYGDEGRDALNNVLADIFGAEAAICSPNVVSGTHALTLALFGVLRTGDTALSITGKPYDTLGGVIYGKDNGSLADYGIKFDCIELKDGDFDFSAIKKRLTCTENRGVKMVYIQRSRGYEWRDALSVNDIKRAIDYVRGFGFKGCIMVDNCYGEFVEEKEPTEVGATLAVGSMIKNIGGGLSPTGGYIVGEKSYVNLVANRLTAPSIGNEVGSYAYGYRLFYQGIFLAPHVVKEALKGSLLFGKVLENCGYETSPSTDKMPYDITRSIKFGNEENLITFIQNVQANSPIDSFVTVMPWDMPGYEEQVIMAAGCFVEGASIELSADAPIKPPFIAYLQGGLTYEHCKITLKNLKL